MYDLLLGGRKRAVRFLAAAFSKPGTAMSRDDAWVAELDGRVAGASVAFPALEGPARARRVLWLLLRQARPRAWPAILRLHLAGEHDGPRPPARSLYVDSLATDPAFRRRGVAMALLQRAERTARAAGLSAVSLDTAETNEGGLALYRSAGFRVTARVEPRAPAPIPPIVALVKALS